MFKSPKHVFYPQIHLMSNFRLKRKIRANSPAFRSIYVVCFGIIGVSLITPNEFSIMSTLFLLVAAHSFFTSPARYKELIAESERRKMAGSATNSETGCTEVCSCKCKATQS